MKSLAEFLAFFRSIPDEKYCVGRFHDYSNNCTRSCARGHLGEDFDGGIPDDVTTLANLLHCHVGTISRINDGDTDSTVRLGDTPKARILAAIEQVLSGIPLFRAVF